MTDFPFNVTHLARDEAHEDELQTEEDEGSSQDQDEGEEYRPPGERQAQNPEAPARRSARLRARAQFLYAEEGETDNKLESEQLELCFVVQVTASKSKFLIGGIAVSFCF